MSARLSIHQHGTTRPHWTTFREIDISLFFKNLSKKLKFR